MKHFSKILISDCHVLQCWKEFSRQVQISCLQMSNWYCVRAGEDDLLCFYYTLDTGDIMLNNFEPNIHEAGCAVVCLYQQTTSNLSQRVPNYYIYPSNISTEVQAIWKVSQVGSDLVSFPWSGHQNTCESTAQKPLVGSGAVLGSEVRKREPVALSQGSGLCFNLALFCVAINISL